MLLAAEATEDLEAAIARFLAAIGWMLDDGRPMTGGAAARAAWDTKAVLRRIGAFAEDGPGCYDSDEPTKGGVAFARAAVRTWTASGARDRTRAR